MAFEKKIVHLMKESHIEILALQETRVNHCSKEEHDDYTFYFSSGVSHETKVFAEQKREQHKQCANTGLSEIQLYNLDAEKHGVGLVYSDKLRHYKKNIQQIDGRLLVATFDTRPLCTHIIVAYAPHALRPQREKDDFYDKLNDALGKLPKHDIILTIGDFNVRLMERLPHEETILGEHIFGTHEDSIDLLTEQQQDNRERFISMCQDNHLVAANTLFQKDPAKLVTYRNTTTPNFSEPFTTSRFAQLDFVLINSRWKNAITNVESSCFHPITTDHKLLVANLRVKLAKRRYAETTKRPKYRPPTQNQIHKYNMQVAELVQDRVPQATDDPLKLWADILHEAANNAFTMFPPAQRKAYISAEAWDLLSKKRQHNHAGSTETAKDLEKQLRKQIRQGQRKSMLQQLEEMDKQGYKWQGLKQMKKKFFPRHTKFKDKDGNPIPESSFPAAAAEYLSSVQWKKPETAHEQKNTSLSEVGAAVNQSAFELEELNAVIKRLKSNKSPGPDEVTSELIKWLHNDNRAKLLVHFNEILLKGTYPASLNLSNIASIYKKGDPAKLENYRPIALLQTFYKILAALVKNRLEPALEPWISKTQYGFRKKKSTSQALFIARRLMDMAERQGTNLTLVLLDWEKAFDKVDQDKLVEVLARLCIPQRIICLIQNIYEQAKFRVVKGNVRSDYQIQNSGIRQGCPLSPYLFGVLMTAIFQDIKTVLNTPKQLQPIPGINYAEVLYADDTLLFGTHTHTINKLLRQIQTESANYNMKLNFDKCINLTINRKQSSIKFMDGTAVPRKTQAKYLGAVLTDAIDNHQEVIRRMGEATAVAKQLNLFWSKARTTVKWKLRVMESIVLNKLTYGLETIQLTQREQNQINAFQLKMFRRVLNIPPTHVDRSWTNQRIIDTLWRSHKYKYVQLSAKWMQKKLTLLGHILRAPHDDPMREILFQPRQNIPRSVHVRRVGKPRANWLLNTFEEAYAFLHPEAHFDASITAHWNEIADAANRREPPFQTKK